MWGFPISIKIVDDKPSANAKRNCCDHSACRKLCCLQLLRQLSVIRQNLYGRFFIHQQHTDYGVRAVNLRGLLKAQWSNGMETATTFDKCGQPRAYLEGKPWKMTTRHNDQDSPSTEYLPVGNMIVSWPLQSLIGFRRASAAHCGPETTQTRPCDGVLEGG